MRWRIVLPPSLLALVAACASFSPDGGMADVASAVRRETGKDAVKLASPEEMRAARERAASLLASPLSADSAVQVALLNNRDLQAAYNELGISEATYVQASLPKNPGVSVLAYGGTGVANFEVRLIQNLLDLITLPARSKIEAEHYAHAKHVAIATTLSLAADVRRAWSGLSPRNARRTSWSRPVKPPMLPRTWSPSSAKRGRAIRWTRLRSRRSTPS
jgi:hypothetical protein